jgi:hypothetical protein
MIECLPAGIVWRRDWMTRGAFDRSLTKSLSACPPTGGFEVKKAEVGRYIDNGH